MNGSGVLRQMRFDPASGRFEVNLVVQLEFTPPEGYIHFMWDDPRLGEIRLLPSKAFCFTSAAAFTYRDEATRFIEQQVELLQLLCNNLQVALMVYGSDQQLDFSPDRFVRNHPELEGVVWRRRHEPQPEPSADPPYRWWERLLGIRVARL